MNDPKATCPDAATRSEDRSVSYESFGGEPIIVWASRQSAHADFGDQRLDVRMAKVLAAMAHKPFDSFTQANDDWGQAKATYRFLQNDKVRFEKIVKAVGAATAERCAGLPMVFVVQDTTSLNYSNLRNVTTGLGGLSGPGNTLGLQLHSTLALSREGVPLGLLHAKYWARPKKAESKGKAKWKPFEKRESYKWMDGLQGSIRNLEDQLRPRSTITYRISQ